MVLVRYSAVSSGQVIPAKRPNDQQSELIGIKYLKQLSVCAGAYQIVTAPIIHGFIHQFSIFCGTSDSYSCSGSMAQKERREWGMSGYGMA